MAKVKMLSKHEQINHDYWNELAKALGWTLYQWTNQIEAQFFIGLVPQNAPLENVTSKMRDDILKALGTVKVELNKPSENGLTSVQDAAADRWIRKADDYLGIFGA